jgi:hypothetical protein
LPHCKPKKMLNSRGSKNLRLLNSRESRKLRLQKKRPFKSLNKLDLPHRKLLKKPRELLNRLKLLYRKKRRKSGRQLKPRGSLMSKPKKLHNSRESRKLRLQKKRPFKSLNKSNLLHRELPNKLR